MPHWKKGGLGGFLFIISIGIIYYGGTIILNIFTHNFQGCSYPFSGEVNYEGCGAILLLGGIITFLVSLVAFSIGAIIGLIVGKSKHNFPVGNNQSNH